MSKSTLFESHFYVSFIRYVHTYDDYCSNSKSCQYVFAHHQCDKLAGLVVHFLAIHNIDNLFNSSQKTSIQAKKFPLQKLTLFENCQRLLKAAKVAKFRQIWSRKLEHNFLAEYESALSAPPSSNNWFRHQFEANQIGNFNVLPTMAIESNEKLMKKRLVIDKLINTA